RRRSDRRARGRNHHCIATARGDGHRRHPHPRRERPAMNAGIDFAPAMTSTVAPTIALVGNPNCGKTALFNALTGSRQKVANYPGVTVERKAGALQTPAGHRVNLIDLPGTYSLRGRSPDQEITREVVLVGAAPPQRIGAG